MRFPGSTAPFGLLAALGALAACGDPTRGPDATSDGAASESGPAGDARTDDAAATDAASSPDGEPGRDASAPGDGATRGAGRVSVELAQPLMIAPLMVSFSEGDPSAACATRADGPCQIVRCDHAAPDAGAADAGPAARAVSAGVLTVSGGSGADLVATPNADGTYRTPLPAPATRWSAGDSVTISAAGDVVPAFRTVRTFPVALRLTSPPSPGGGAFAGIDRAAGLTVGWEPASGSDDVNVVVQQNRPDATVTVTCTFPRTAGTGTAPPSALADLSASDGSSNVAIVVVEAQSAETVNAGGFRVLARAATLAVIAPAAGVR